jgi:hypothetical protein
VELYVAFDAEHCCVLRDESGVGPSPVGLKLFSGEFWAPVEWKCELDHAASFSGYSTGTGPFFVMT